MAERSSSEKLLRALHAAYCRDASRQELLQITAEGMRAWGEPFTSVYLYMLHGNQLELEAFSGRPTDHTAISVGTGVCGRAVAERRDINAPDVTAEPEYLACNLETKSELVVLIRRGDEILGQIDVDSDTPSGFGTEEETSVKEVADGLATLL